MKIILIAALVVVAMNGVVFAANNSKLDSTNAVATSGKTLYTCGMHPWIIQDHPGNCPICGMKLEPVRNTAKTADSSAIAIDPATIQLMNIQITTVGRGPLRRTIRTVGTIEYNETALANVTTKFKGWIEKLDVDATGQLVHRGEPLFEIYSPELYGAESEYLAVANATNDAGPSILRDAARDKLKFFDISDTQIVALEKSG
ncbi:MAG TPA: efflux RND transporter periplasmic adaptor subunit, partial [Candidatus Baltobacteraceae bacterium]|nr:efflux RND transporter periplasmic adaptor subunit [Candidatus Baltobacteraceae bacterium]